MKRSTNRIIEYHWHRLAARELLCAVAEDGRHFLLTSSSKARGVTGAAIKDGPAQFATPDALARLIVSHHSQTLTHCLLDDCRSSG